MSRQPRFEELDEDAEDPDELDLPDFGGPSSSTLSRNDFPQPSTGGLPPSAAAAGGGFNRPQMISQETLEQYKNWPCVYPVYFDASRSLQEGRRVPLKFAVKNPLAKELASAAASLNIRSIFEVLSLKKMLSLSSQIKHILKIGLILDEYELNSKQKTDEIERISRVREHSIRRWQNISKRILLPQKRLWKFKFLV